MEIGSYNSRWSQEPEEQTLKLATGGRPTGVRVERMGAVVPCNPHRSHLPSPPRMRMHTAQTALRPHG